jgi:hypothetical protein
MDFEGVKALLTAANIRRARNCRICGVLGIVLGPVALVVAAILVYCILRVFTYDKLGASGHVTCLWISAAVIPLMFLGNLVVPRRDLMEERMCNGAPDSFIGHETNKGVVIGHLFLWIMFTGPRLFSWASSQFRESKRLLALDTHSCAAVLWLLLCRNKKVPYEDIQTELPWLEMDSAIPQLLTIPGVVRLQTAPAGLSMTQDLRDAIRAGRME